VRRAVAAALLLGLAACGSPAPPAAAPSTVVSTRDPVTQCADRLLYWLERIRTSPDASGLDYQEMGLTGAEFEELTKLEALTGPADTQAREACVRIEALPKPSGGTGWPG